MTSLSKEIYQMFQYHSVKSAKYLKGVQNSVKLYVKQYDQYITFI